MNMRLTVHGSFDAAHRLAMSDVEPCDSLHGHRWNIDLCVKGDIADDRRYNFRNLKKELGVVVNHFDHATILSRSERNKNLIAILEAEGNRVVQMDMEPTAESLAKLIHRHFERKAYKGVIVSVYETPNNYAQYSGASNLPPKQQQPTKRKRGRPRKDAKPETVDQKPVKRKRGRPRKNA